MSDLLGLIGDTLNNLDASLSRIDEELALEQLHEINDQQSDAIEVDLVDIDQKELAEIEASVMNEQREIELLESQLSALPQEQNTQPSTEQVSAVLHDQELKEVGEKQLNRTNMGQEQTGIATQEVERKTQELPIKHTENEIKNKEPAAMIIAVQKKNNYQQRTVQQSKVGLDQKKEKTQEHKASTTVKGAEKINKIKKITKKFKWSPKLKKKKKGPEKREDLKRQSTEGQLKRASQLTSKNKGQEKKNNRMSSKESSTCTGTRRNKNQRATKR